MLSYNQLLKLIHFLLIIPITIWLCWIPCYAGGEGVTANTGETITDESLEKYGYALENVPFEVRNDFFKNYRIFWRKANYEERKKFFKKWMKANPHYGKEEEREAKVEKDSNLSKEYGEDLNKAPFDARFQYFNNYRKSWKNVSYEEKKDFLENWLIQNKKYEPIDAEIEISDDLKSILKKIHREYGKDLYAAPFDARMEYYQIYNTSWYSISYIERKMFLADWYKDHQEKIDKLKKEMQAELARNLENKLDSLRFVDLEIPESYGDKLQDVPFEMKRQHYEETGKSWTSLNSDIRELYAKKWLLEHKEFLDRERLRINKVEEHKIKRYEAQEQIKFDHDEYKEILRERKIQREKKKKEKKKQEEKRQKKFKKRVERQQKKLKKMIRERDREKNK